MKAFPAAALAVVLMTACTQTEKKTEIAENPDGSMSTITVETSRTTGLDTASVKSAVARAKEKLHVAAERLDTLAVQADEGLQRAGKKLKTSVQQGSENLKNKSEEKN